MAGWQFSGGGRSTAKIRVIKQGPMAGYAISGGSWSIYLDDAELDALVESIRQAQEGG